MTGTLVISPVGGGGTPPISRITPQQLTYSESYSPYVGAYGFTYTERGTSEMRGTTDVPSLCADVQFIVSSTDHTLDFGGPNGTTTMDLSNSEKYSEGVEFSVLPTIGWGPCDGDAGAGDGGAAYSYSTTASETGLAPAGGKPWVTLAATSDSIDLEFNDMPMRGDAVAGPNCTPPLQTQNCPATSFTVSGHLHVPMLRNMSGSSSSSGPVCGLRVPSLDGTCPPPYVYGCTGICGGGNTCFDRPTCCADKCGP